VSQERGVGTPISSGVVGAGGELVDKEHAFGVAERTHKVGGQPVIQDLKCGKPQERVSLHDAEGGIRITADECAQVFCTDTLVSKPLGIYFSVIDRTRV